MMRNAVKNIDVVHNGKGKMFFITSLNSMSTIVNIKFIIYFIARGRTEPPSRRGGYESNALTA